MSQRYVVRRHDKDSERFGVDIWGVYDTVKPSWPAYIAGRKIVHFTKNKAEADRDATWLNGLETS
jgi:hypothetical protein